MSKRINEILEVLREVQAKFRMGMSLWEFKRVRLSAIKRIAKRRGIDHTTVSDKFRRQLYPDVDGTDDFDRLLYSWFSEGSTKLRSVLLKHVVNHSDTEAIESFFETLHSQPTPVASDIAEPSQPERVKQETYRILRDTALARQVKEVNKHRCQICGDTLTLKDGIPYAEAHHIKPLGRPHNGPDVHENIMCVCPNHHVLLDYGAIKLDAAQLTGVDSEYIDYHNEHIYGKA